MYIQYTGRRRRRIVGPYEWNEENGFVCEVTEPEILEDLLTDPFNEFSETTKPKPKKKKWWNEPTPAPSLKGGEQAEEKEV
jgi:hypothetical protein